MSGAVEYGISKGSKEVRKEQRSKNGIADVIAHRRGTICSSRLKMCDLRFKFEKGPIFQLK